MSDVRDVHEAHQQPEIYQKKPVNIEAMEFHGTVGSGSSIVEWIMSNGGEATFYDKGQDDYDLHNPYLYIHTLEGLMRASQGDFIIRGVSNEFYPCKPKIFWETYVHVGSGKATA